MARHNASIVGLGEMEWTEGDAGQLRDDEASFDVVLSRYGHMFALRPDVVAVERLGAQFEPPFFERAAMLFAALSAA